MTPRLLRRYAWRALLAVAACIAVAGCMVGPNYVRPVTPTPPAFKEGVGWTMAQPGDGTPQKHKYLVGGLPREQVNQIAEMFGKGAQGVTALQIAPICLFNAFEFAQPDVFKNHAFFLIDIGHSNSTMMIGVKRELVLVRQIEFGGKVLIDTLMALSGESRESVFKALEQEDEVMIENTRMAILALTREVGSSIGFFEGRREETIGQICVSGGPAKSKAFLKVMSEELHMPCEVWNPFAKCDMALSGKQKANFVNDVTKLNVACGAAVEFLKSK